MFQGLEPRLVLDSTVVFNEVMYNPAGPEESLEWVELYNQTAIDMDISGWSIRGGIDYDFVEGTIVPGRGYLVVAADPAQLSGATGFTEALGPFADTEVGQCVVDALSNVHFRETSKPLTVSYPYKF